MMNGAILLISALSTVPTFAADLPGDVQTYVDRREACNYWPSKTAPRHSLRAAEIERHTRNLHCDTLAREEVILRARYKGDAARLAAIDQARDAMPDN